MRIGVFSMPKVHEKMMMALEKELSIKFVFYRHKNNVFHLSLNSIKMFSKVEFKEAIDYSLKFFYARNRIKPPLFLLKLYFSIELFFKYIKYSLIIDNKNDLYIFWNGKKPRHLIAIQIIKLLDIKIKYMENGLLPNRLVFDGNGVNFENSVPRNRRFFEEYTNNLHLPVELTPRIPKNRNKFSKKVKALPKNFIFVPFQVDYDSQILLYSPWIKNMVELFNLIEDISNDLDYIFVIKEHPSSNKNYLDLHKRCEKLEKIEFVNGYSTQELIEKSQAVMTINSTVGIESLLFYKKVIVIGDAFYNIDGITKSAKNRDQLLAVIKSLNDWKFETSLVENFLKYLYYEYLIPSDNYNAKQFFEILSKK